MQCYDFRDLNRKESGKPERSIRYEDGPIKQYRYMVISRFPRLVYDKNNNISMH